MPPATSTTTSSTRVARARRGRRGGGQPSAHVRRPGGVVAPLRRCSGVRSGPRSGVGAARGPGGDVAGRSEVEVLPGVRLVRIGGHFPGSAVAHFVGADGRGVLLSGDTVACTPDERWVSFMRSFPNKIPLSAAVVGKVADRVLRLDFDRLYDNFGGRVTQRRQRVGAPLGRPLHGLGARRLRPPHRARARTPVARYRVAGMQGLRCVGPPTSRRRDNGVLHAAAGPRSHRRAKDAPVELSRSTCPTRAGRGGGGDPGLRRLPHRPALPRGRHRGRLPVPARVTRRPGSSRPSARAYEIWRPGTT